MLNLSGNRHYKSLTIGGHAPIHLFTSNKNKLQKKRTIKLQPSDAALKPIIQEFSRDVVLYLPASIQSDLETITSFFGGVPVAPSEFIWPRAIESGVPLTFMGQINLRDFPKIEFFELLPGDGAIYFFIDANDDASGRERKKQQVVMHFAGNPSKWLEVAQPTDLQPIGLLASLGRAEQSVRPNSFAKAAIKPTLSRQYPPTPHRVTEPIIFEAEDHDAVFDQWVSIAERHALRMSQLQGHQSGGYPEVYQRDEEIDGDDLLLMQFSNDPALGWFFGEGGFQYWISKDDLKERRWSQVRLTFEIF